MFLAQGGAENLKSLEPVIVVLAIGSVLFWRLVLKLVVIAVVAVIASGVIFFVQHLHHVPK
jgi:hypothetical protein